MWILHGMSVNFFPARHSIFIDITVLGTYVWFKTSFHKDPQQRQHKSKWCGNAASWLRRRCPFSCTNIQSLKIFEGEPKHWSQLLKDVAKSSSAQGFAQCAAPALEEFLLKQFPEHIYDGQLDKVGSCALLSLALWRALMLPIGSWSNLQLRRWLKYFSL